MERKDWEEYIDKTIIGTHEKGFQSHSKDTGNYVNGKNIGTNFGITPKTYAEYKGVSPTSISRSDMKNLKKKEAIDIYLTNYLYKHGIDNIVDAIECKELWNVDNGITYCVDCHKIIHQNLRRVS